MTGNSKTHRGPLPDGQNPMISLHIPTRRTIQIVVSVCLLLEVLFVFLDYAINQSFWTELGPIRRLFNITREDGIASWFGVTQTLMVALTLWMIYVIESNRGVSTGARVGWLVLALFFTYMTVDDGAEIHERVGSAFKAIQEQAVAAGSADATLYGRLYNRFPSYPWQLIFGPVFAALGLFMLVFLFRKLQTTRRRLALFMSVGLMAVAVVFDFFEGLEPGHRWNVYTMISTTYEMDYYTVTKFRELPYDSLRHFSKSIEEFLEMLATTILWAALLGHLGSRANRFDVTFDP